MNKIIITLLSLTLFTSLHAQVIKVYENGALIETYKNTTDKKYRIVLEETPTILITSLTLNTTSTSIMVGKTETLTATILPDDASNKSCTWSSSDESVATVSSDGVVTALAEGTATVTCKANDNSGVIATCEVKVYKDASGTIDGHKYVDLGLPSGTLWATEDIKWYSWGSTSYYSDCSSSSYYDKGYSSKYSSSTDRTELNLSDDIAYKSWGTNWRMPSKEQLEELVAQCTYQESSNGGYFISKNGNSIYLPFNGTLCGMESYENVGLYGMYWSRTVKESERTRAYQLGVGTNAKVYTTERYFGLSIRPVLLCVKSIKLKDASVYVETGSTKTLSATILPVDANMKSCSWSSSDETVATVSSDGVVTGMAEGTAIITCIATDGSEVSDNCLISVGSKTIVYDDLSTTAYGSGALTTNTLTFYANQGDLVSFDWMVTDGYGSNSTTFYVTLDGSTLVSTSLPKWSTKSGSISSQPVTTTGKHTLTIGIKGYYNKCSLSNITQSISQE